jgi:hypothetical protein
MGAAWPCKRLDVLTRQLTSAAVDEPALLQQSDLAMMCPKALQAVLLHDNGQLRNSIYEFMKVNSLIDDVRGSRRLCNMSAASSRVHAGSRWLAACSLDLWQAPACQSLSMCACCLDWDIFCFYVASSINAAPHHACCASWAGLQPVPSFFFSL